MKNNNKISFADLNDSDEIMSFIDLEWKKDHILATDRNFFLSEYRNSDKLNFVISKSPGKKINAILGFLKSSDDELASVWTTMWKVSSKANSIMLGVELLRYLKSHSYRCLMSNGISAKTAEIYEYLGFHTGVMSHFYLANRGIRDHKIAQFITGIPRVKIKECVVSSLQVRLLSASDLSSSFNFDKYNP